MESTEPTTPPHHVASESLSAFVVGLMYFIVQWIWQMENIKRSGGVPFAFALLIGLAITGALSFHSVMVFNHYPPIRQRVFNVLLFTPFALSATFSYEGALVTARGAAATPSAMGWHSNTAVVIIAGVAIGFLPLIAAKGIRHIERQQAMRQVTQLPPAP